MKKRAAEKAAAELAARTPPPAPVVEPAARPHHLHSQIPTLTNDSVLEMVNSEGAVGSDPEPDTLGGQNQLRLIDAGSDSSVEGRRYGR